MFAESDVAHLFQSFWWVVLLVVVVPVVVWWLTVKVIPNDKVGVVEKLWSHSGSVSGGRIIALTGEAGYQADLLRGGPALRPVAVAVPRSRGAARDRAAGPNRVRVRP